MRDWLEEQKERILVEADKELFDEIAQCYRNGLFRAGYILAWILLMQSLRRKISELETLGDARATSENAKIAKKEADHESVDKQIYASARACEVIDDAQHTTIDGLWQQRCLYAHPYSKPAKEYDLSHIINQIIDISLSKEVVFSRTMIDDMVQLHIKTPHIIPLDEDDLRDYLKSKLVRVQIRHYPYLYKTLFFEFSQAIDAKNQTARKFCGMGVNVLVNEFGANISDASFTLDTQLASYPFKFIVLWTVKSMWDKLSPKQQDDIFRYIDSETRKIYKELYLRRIRELIKAGFVFDANKTAIYYRLLDSFSSINTEDYYFDKDLYLDKLEDEFISRGQFVEQAEYVDFISGKEFPLVGYSPNQKRRLGEFVSFSCRVGTFKAQEFINSSNHAWAKDDDFTYGMIQNFVAHKGETRIERNRVFYQAILYRERPDIAIAAINDAIALPTYEFTPDFVAKQYVEEINNTDIRDDVKEALAKLAEKCCKTP